VCVPCFFLQNDLISLNPQLIDETHDFSTDDDTDPEEDVPFRTPKSTRKTPKVNRIWTAGTPSSKIGNTPKSRQSVALSKLFELEPDMMLPASDSSPISSADGSEDDDAGFMDVEATPIPAKHGARHIFHSDAGIDEEEERSGGSDGDVLSDDAPSMTLKDILLSADTSNFDLLGSSFLRVPSFRHGTYAVIRLIFRLGRRY